MPFQERIEIYTVLVIILALSSMGVSLYLNCGSCDNKQAKNLHAAFAVLVALSVLAIVVKMGYDMS